MFAHAGRNLVHRTLGPLAAHMPNVHPNVLTVCGLFVAAMAGYAFCLTDRDPAFFLVAAGLGLIYGILDALDGLVARAHRKTSAWGGFLDHTFDRLAALLALGGLALAQHTNDALALTLMLGTLWHGYLGTQLEASFGRRIYRGVGTAEALIVAIMYSFTAYAVRAAGLPFSFREPFTGTLLTVSDAFAIAAYPLIVLGTFQRFALGRALARERGEIDPSHSA